MDINDIPQDDSPSYRGHQKIIYGTHNGRYQAATSTGWQDESYATVQAVAELEEQTEAAKQAVERGVYAHSRRASLWKKRGRVCMSHAMACQTRPRGHCLKNRQGTHANAFFRSRGYFRAVNKPFISRG